jgi:hypothetical protein
VPIDSQIALGIRPVQVADPLEQAGKILGIKGAMQQQQLHGVQLQSAQREFESGTQIRDLLRANPNASPEQVMAIDPEKGLAFRKSALENATANAKLLKTHQEVLGKAIAQHRDDLADVKTPDDMAHWVSAGYSDPIMGPVLSSKMPLAAALAKIPTDPAAFEEMKRQQALGATKFIEMNKPHVMTQDTGGASNVVATPGLGGAPQVLSTTPKTVTPSAAMADKTRRQIAGIDAEGLPTGDVKEVAKAIAEYRMAPLSGFAIARPRGQQIMAEVMNQNPDYDIADAQVKFKAAKDFGTGKQGNTVRSFNVALAHLDTLDKLSDALHNKDIPAINRIGNAFAAETGSAAPVNFDAAKKIVGDEIVKAIVGSGGGVTDREEAAKTVSRANSPAQLKGVIATYKELMRGQLGGLRQQYETTTGRKDFDKYLSQSAQQQAHPAAPAGGPPPPPKLGERRDGYIYKGGDPADPKSWDK